MKLVKPSVEILAAYGHNRLPYSYDRPEELIEAAGRTCYKSGDKAWAVCPECQGKGIDSMTDSSGAIECHTCDGGRFKTSAEKFVEMVRKRGHFSVLEHSWRVCTWGMNYPLSTEKLRFLHRINSKIAGNMRAWEESGLWREVAPKPTTIPTNDAKFFPEMFAMTARIICDRGVSHEIVRHRPASYSQESTRYCNYGGGVTFVIPPWVDVLPGEYPIEWRGLYGYSQGEALEPAAGANAWWFWHCAVAERDYLKLLKQGWRPEHARSVLPNSLKTEIVMTASLAEWQHVFRLRCSLAAHPQMRETMEPLRDQARALYPEVF